MSKLKIINDTWSKVLKEYIDYDYYQVDDYRIKKPIPLKFLNDDEISIDGEHLKIIHDSNIVELEITNAIGYSNGIHYYGELHLDIKVIVPGTNIRHSAYLGMPNKDLPLAFTFNMIEIKLNREVTQEDKIQHPDRFLDYRIGEKTYKFQTRSGLIKYAKEFCKKYLPDYKLKIKK